MASWADVDGWELPVEQAGPQYRTSVRLSQSSRDEGSFRPDQEQAAPTA